MFQCPVVGVGLFFMATSSTTGRSMAIAFASAGRKLRRNDADALGSSAWATADSSGDVRVGAVTLERGAVGQTEVGHLQPGDGAVGVVVHDDPDDAQAVFDRGGEHGRVLAEPTVAHQRHHGAVGCGELGPDGGGRAEAHGRESPRGEHGAGGADGELLTDTVLVPSHVGGDIGVVGQHATRVGEDPLGHHREGVAGGHR